MRYNLLPAGVNDFENVYWCNFVQKIVELYTAEIMRGNYGTAMNHW